MSTVQLEKSKLIAAYKDADQNGKALLAALHGKEACEGDLADRLKTFAEVCAYAGVNEADYAIDSAWTDQHKADGYFLMLQLVAKVFNQGWVPDLADTNQNKYYPWFNIVKDKTKLSGFGLSFYGYVSGLSCTSLGVRLYYKDSNTAKYVGTQFIDLYEKMGQHQNLASMAA